MKSRGLHYNWFKKKIPWLTILMAYVFSENFPISVVTSASSNADGSPYKYSLISAYSDVNVTNLISKSVISVTFSMISIRLNNLSKSALILSKSARITAVGISSSTLADAAAYRLADAAAYPLAGAAAYPLADATAYPPSDADLLLFGIVLLFALNLLLWNIIFVDEISSTKYIWAQD